MSELEVKLNEILTRYPAQSKLEVRILDIQKRPEHGDKIIKRRYVLTVDYDTVISLEES